MEAVQDPLADHPATHVREWFRVIVEQFPLWACQASAYQALYRPELPTTYPLRLMIETVLRDDGMSPDGQPLGELESVLDVRRCGVCRGRIELGRLVRGSAQFRPSFCSDLVYWEPEHEHGGGGLVSPYEDLGREFLKHIEDHRFASGKAERRAAKERLETFLRAVEAKLSRGQPGPPLPVLEGLLTEARSLVELSWDLLWGKFEISDRTRQVLAARQITEDAMRLWAARLALPVFSRLELGALRPAPIPNLGLLRALTGITPRRFAIWLVAHRLGIGAPSLARTMQGTKAASYFQGIPNPIDRLVRH